jgi:hypothetical protein
VNVSTLNELNIKAVARLMAQLKPEFWDLEGAATQLDSGIGWCLTTDADRPTGWLLCQWYAAYRTGEIECLGYDDGGQFKVGPELHPLVERCERWIREQGGVNSRFVIGSRGLSCHGKVLGEPWQELAQLEAVDREEYEWFVVMGYAPSGILPDIYGVGHHGILLLKRIRVH